jgi:hypothetical protein
MQSFLLAPLQTENYVLQSALVRCPQERPSYSTCVVCSRVAQVYDLLIRCAPREC